MSPLALMSMLVIREIAPIYITKRLIDLLGRLSARGMYYENG
jgi:hypothetical protein